MRTPEAAFMISQNREHGRSVNAPLCFVTTKFGLCLENGRLNWYYCEVKWYKVEGSATCSWENMVIRSIPKGD